MGTLFKPMLATDVELSRLKFPVLASAKLDGVRAVVRDGVVYSRSNKPIPNKFVQEKFKHLEYYDGELIVGDPTSKTCYRDTVSHVMSHDKRDFEVSMYVFDHVWKLNDPYELRLSRIQAESGVVKHHQANVNTMDELIAMEERYLDAGYEGLILRGHTSPYKMGRSTMKEGFLLKMKRFVDAEFKVVGFEERMHNGNEKTTNELGRGQRSSHQANKHGRGDLGALVVEGNGYTFNVGTGFDDSERAAIWANRADYLGGLAKVKYFPIGMKDAPRHPVFLGWRKGD